jgi:hypothetical protein
VPSPTEAASPSASEEDRRALFERVSAHLDEETARLLLEVTVPADIELATRGDIQELRAEMLLRFTELDGRLTRQIPELDGRLTGQIAGLSKELTDKLYRRVLPSIALMLGFATFVSRVSG